MTSVSMSWYQV